ncbi:hypothetical protein FQN54_004412 [Arachnomyces sp. PD_36]|nr:hypothetical protein FQN54_004412 [Arachnomyces sp. PD_36]
MCPHSGNPGPTTGKVADPTSIPSCVPSDPRAQSAYTLAATKLPVDILNHSVRVYLYAKWVASKSSSPWASDPGKLPLLFVSCVLHDIGCAPEYDGEQRFEVEGADVAAKHLRDWSEKGKKTEDSDIHEVWQGIALHTSPHIAERISPFAKFVRTGVLIDFGRPLDLEGIQEEKKSGEEKFPRLNIEKVLSDTVAEQGVRQRQKAPPGTWPGMLVQSKLDNPGWTGVNKAF